MARFTVALVFAALAVLPATAHAAEPEDVWQTVGVAVHDLGAGKTPTLVIVAQARAGLTPPVEAAIAVPKGSELSWAGELLGGDPNDDPTLEVTREARDGYDLIKFTLVNSPRVQLELTVPGDMLARTDTTADIDLAWTSAGDVDAARLALYVPIDAHLENASPEPTVQAVPGQHVLYSVETSPVAAGQTLTFSGRIAVGVAPEMEAAQGGADEATASGDATAAPEGSDSDEPQVAEQVSGLAREVRWIIGGLAVLLAVAAGFLVRAYVLSRRK